MLLVMANVPEELVFEVSTTLGFNVRLQTTRWRLVKSVKHLHNLSGGRHQGWGENLGTVKILYDQEGGTLTVWFGNPQDERTCEETGDEIVLMKDKDGHVIGFERLSFYLPPQDELQVVLESV